MLPLKKRDTHFDVLLAESQQSLIVSLLKMQATFRMKHSAIHSQTVCVTFLLTHIISDMYGRICGKSIILWSLSTD